jgi:hypothetical protein
MNLDTARAALVSFFGLVGFTVSIAVAVVLIIGHANHLWPVVRTRHFDLTPHNNEGFELDWEKEGSDSWGDSL